MIKNKNGIGAGIAGFVLGAAAVAAGLAAHHYYTEIERVRLKDASSKADESNGDSLKRDDEGNVIVAAGMTGLLSRIDVKEGDKTAAGDTIMIIGNTIPVVSPVTGTIKTISIKEGTLVSEDETVAVIEEAGDEDSDEA